MTHLDDVPRMRRQVGHLDARWSFVGEAAGSESVGMRRIEIPAGGWSTPAHEHGRAEEIFYVLSGSGESWQAGRTTRIGAGDCIVYLAASGAHTLHADEGLDVLAFGPRPRDESPRFPRIDLSLVGGRGAYTVTGVVGHLPLQFVREAAAGPPDLPAPGDRPATVVSVSEVAPDPVARGRVARTRRNLGRAAGSRTTGLQHVDVAPGAESAPQHCHSVEEELFVVLAGGGTLVLGDEEIPVREGHVVARPPGTGVAHMFRAGEGGLTYLAYGTRDPGDVCYYPRSGKIAFRGVKLIARLESLDYWDGEE
jgi:uncharacterized cupin superfamily protein